MSGDSAFPTTTFGGVTEASYDVVAACGMAMMMNKGADCIDTAVVWGLDVSRLQMGQQLQQDKYQH